MKQVYLLLFLLFTVAASAQDMAENDTVKIEEIPNFKLYPNPAFDDVVYITTERNGNKNIVIYDVFGEVVLRDKISSTVLNISKLSPGVYVLKVTEENKCMTRKLVVK
ncbi:hypothetical protein GGR42_001597 [Saonia flava]|uniref:Secretion system C-terminal sorting domain-containing protein n=1 Tax=Saonia flava TaxID=523696 RepID=A0A846QZP4_9FLAO|nr:T9SS type A sorting domain-containing protein [Saonia flava]NJB71135.1 hypothetical protein [Saonia flava]